MNRVEVLKLWVIKTLYFVRMPTMKPLRSVGCMYVCASQSADFIFFRYSFFTLSRSNSGDKSANGGGMNPGGGPGGMKSGQNNQNDPMGASSSDGNICRDFMRNGQSGCGISSIQ